MLHRNISASMAFLAIAALVAPIQSGEAEEAAASECLSRPNKAAPDGSHWWYRIDRSTHRRCWYLGQQRTAVRRPARARRAAPPPNPSPSEAALPEPEQAQTPAPAAAAADDRRAAVTDESRMASPAESGTVASPAESGNIAAATFSAVWPPVPNSTASNDPGATITDPGATTTDSPDEADDAVPTEQPADMPLVWPELTDADRTALTDANRAVVMQSSNAAPGIGQLFLFIATLAAFVAVALHAIVKLRKSWVGYRNSPALSQTAQAPVQPMPAIGAPNESDVFARWRASAREDRLRRNSRWERDRSADLTREKRTVAA